MNTKEQNTQVAEWLELAVTNTNEEYDKPIVKFDNDDWCIRLKESNQLLLDITSLDDDITYDGIYAILEKKLEPYTE